MQRADTEVTRLAGPLTEESFNSVWIFFFSATHITTMLIA